MLTRRDGGFVEFIPTPAEKRDGVLRDHCLALVGNLHTRLRRLEDELGLDVSLAEEFEARMARIDTEEMEASRVHSETINRS